MRTKKWTKLFNPLSKVSPNTYVIELYKVKSTQIRER